MDALGPSKNILGDLRAASSEVVDLLDMNLAASQPDEGDAPWPPRRRLLFIFSVSAALWVGIGLVVANLD
jgi:hypothetical protein